MRQHVRVPETRLPIRKCFGSLLKPGGLSDCYLLGVSLISTAAVFANSLAWVHLWVQFFDPAFQLSGNTCLSVLKHAR